MFEFNYSVGEIRNSDFGEGIVCSGEESEVRGREVGESGREMSTPTYTPPAPVHPHGYCSYREPLIVIVILDGYDNFGSLGCFDIKPNIL